jgi:hypothetical protein
MERRVNIMKGSILIAGIVLMLNSASVYSQETIKYAEKVTISAEAYNFLKGRDKNLKTLEESVFKIKLPKIIFEFREDGTFTINDSIKVNNSKKPLMARVELGYLYDDEVPLKIDFEHTGNMKKTLWEKIDFPLGLLGGAVITYLLGNLF